MTQAHRREVAVRRHRAGGCRVAAEPVHRGRRRMAAVLDPVGDKHSEDMPGKS